MKYALQLGKFFGIKVQIHWSFLILLSWIVISNVRSGSGTVQTLWSILFVLTIFLCVTLHEFGHALAAKRFGIKTKDITLLPIGGLARLESIPEKPREELIVAIAGPLVNIAIVLLLYPLIHFTTDITSTISSLTSITSQNFLFNLMFINLWLAIFNLIPAFPMDGGRVLRALLAFRLERHKATAIAARIGQMLAVGFIFLGFFSNPFLVLIGLFIFLGAQGETEYTQAKSMLKGYTVNDVIMKQYQTLSPNDTIKEAVALLLNGQSKSFLVIDNEQVLGTLNRDEIIKALSSEGENSSINHVMNKEIVALKAETPLEDAWQIIQQHKMLMPVYSYNQLIGTLDTENILEFIMIKNAESK
ncbi:MAG: site-2 protease family protein [Bacteroidota bacterium]|nr:site-2 protease family protein [Bacteroidota bacterium]